MIYTIKSALSPLNIELTQDRIDRFDMTVRAFEVRRTHPLALNSQMLGVHPIVFTDVDREALFTIFDVSEKTLKLIVQKIPSINKDFKVRSDPFNILSGWLIHLAFQQINDTERREHFQLNIAKYFHYRFFTSLVNRYFSHGAVEKYMVAAVNNLSRKFDIVVYGTWKAAIEVRCKDLISSNSIHRQALETVDDDEAFLKMIQDVQTRIRDKVKNITAAYYAAREQGDTIGSRSSTRETENGVELVNKSKTFDLMIYNLQNEIMTARLFIDTETVRQIVLQSSSITVDLLRSALLSLVDIAGTQRDSGQLDLIRMNEGCEVYVGMRAYLTNLIQKTYRHCMINGVDITNKAQVFTKTKNIYSSSRINDEDVLAVKQSTSYLVDLISTSRRETTKSSLRIGIILYIIIRSFRFI